MKRNFVKKVCGVVLTGVCMASLAACGSSANNASGSAAKNTESSEQKSAENSSESSGGEQIADPFTVYDSLEKAEKAAGFDISLPDAPDGYSVITYRVDSDGKLLEVIYSDKATEEEGFKEAYRVRKAPSDVENISGDYNEYSNTATEDISGNSVTLKGDGDNISLATWTTGDYTYSVSFDFDGNGTSKDDAVKVIGAIQ